MAKTLAAFPSEDESQRRNRYPWDKWLDGNVWELTHGSREAVAEGDADFSVTTKSFESAVKQAVSAREGAVRLAPRRNDKGERVGLVIQFLPGDETPPETPDDE